MSNWEKSNLKKCPGSRRSQLNINLILDRLQTHHTTDRHFSTNPRIPSHRKRFNQPNTWIDFKIFQKQKVHRKNILLLPWTNSQMKIQITNVHTPFENWKYSTYKKALNGQKVTHWWGILKYKIRCYRASSFTHFHKFLIERVHTKCL